MKTNVTPLLRNLAAGFLLLLAALILPVSAQTSHVVNVTSNVFTPDELTISVGDTVIWTNSEGNHNVNGTQTTYPSNPESFGNAVGAGWTFSHVFTQPGKYDYQCDPHVGWGMVGKVEVKDLSSSDMTLNLTGMTPHVGQEIYIALVDAETGNVIDRESEIVQESFSVLLSGVESGSSYRVDFFTDHNGNGFYDAPPADHAWRLEVPAASGGEVLNFAHNTEFTDIEWKHRLRIRFEGMTPHVGQMLTLFVRDLSSGEYLDTVVVPSIEDEKFDVESHVLEVGGSYQIDFYADHNGNSSYDTPPDDHAWRIESGVAMGDVDLDFTHNTNFTDIFGTTSVARRESEPGLSLYPNPAQTYVHIDSEEQISTVVLYDTRGSSLRTLTDVHTSQVSLSLEGIRAGVYFVEVRTTDQQLKISRLVKQ
jgi:plastocyanin